MKLADGFGNYLYIIMAVVYVIYSIIKAGKKVTQNRPTIDKQPESPTTVQPPATSPFPEHNPGDDLKKMLDDLMGRKSEEPVPQKPIIKPKPLVVAKKPKPAKVLSTISKKEKQAAYQEKKKETAKPTAFVAHPEIVQQVFAENTSEEVNIDGSPIDFDIRQAVIYSEIMKRPNW